MSNGGMLADSAGYLYAVTGNGTFDANTNGSDLGDAVVKLAPPAAGATLDRHEREPVLHAR